MASELNDTVETPATTPALTVAIAALGAAQPLMETLRSIASQTDASCEILVIDDGLRESTALCEAATADPRIRIHRNEQAIGETRSLQRAVDYALGRLIMFVEAGDVLLPGALRVMCDAVSDADDIAMAHAYWVPLGFVSRVSRRALRAHRALLLERLPPGLDHRRALVVLGNVVQALPTFRRAALQADGGLVGKSMDEALYAATLNALAHGEARVVPRLLCAPRSPRARGWKLRGRPAHLRAVARCARIMRSGGARALWTPRQFSWLVGVFLVDRLTRRYPLGWRYRVRRLGVRWAVWARSAPGWRTLLRVRRPYEAFAALVPRKSFPPLRRRSPSSPPSAGTRIAYVLWRYPALSETFIRREVEALRQSGLPLEVVALEPDNPPLLPDAASPAGTVTYYGPTDDDAARAFLMERLRRDPFTVLRLWLWLAGHRYHAQKTWWRDRNTLFDAAHLALALRRLGISHVHSPWADQTATFSSIAARLLGLTFSVQARAAEIHRSTEPPAVLERLLTARFVITNSCYNEQYLHSLMKDGTAPALSVIYNGVELHRFQPAMDRARSGDSWRLVCVARLAEFKGLCHLLRVCRSLRDHGIDFTCEIIGGPENAGYAAAWVHLRKLHTELGLDPCVHFRGAQPFSAVLSALQNADIFVLPSVHARDGAHDVTPNALIEAMAMALPVISTPTGAIPEIVDSEVNGLLVPAGNEAALLAAIERLLADHELRQRLGRAARRKIEERFDIARNVEHRLTLFRSM